MTQQETAPVDPQGQPPADGSTGTELGTQATPAAQPQPTDKDYRHATQMITREIDKKMRISRRLVERDPDAILDIAAEDPDLAEKLMQEIPDLRQKSQPADLSSLRSEIDAVKDEARRANEKLREADIQRLKEKHPDLTDDLEAQFRQLYSDPRFTDLDTEKLVDVARALAGKPARAAGAEDAALDLLRANEGASVTPRGSTAQQDYSHETPQQRHIRQQFGHSEEDVKQLGNVDHLIAI